MFDIGWSELFLIGVVALVVIGPKDLPFALRALGRFMAQLRSVGQQFRATVDEMVREAEVEELRKKAREVIDLEPEKTIADVVDPEGDLRAALTVPDFSVVPPADDPEPETVESDGRAPEPEPAASPPAPALRTGT